MGTLENRGVELLLRALPVVSPDVQWSSTVTFAANRGVVDLNPDLTEDPDAKAPWKERKVAYLAHLQDTDDDTRTVSMADKLHNARAIVTDLRISGHTTWDRFNSSREEILWYYTEILNIGLARSSNAFLKSNLQATVTEMTDLDRAHREQQ